MTIHELHQKLVAKELSAVELTNAVIAHKAKTEPLQAHTCNHPVFSLLCFYTSLPK